MKRKSKDEVIDLFLKTHGDKYDYSKVEYVNTDTKVCIICPEHGEFWQTPYNHIKGQGCPECGKERTSKSKRNTLDTFLKKAKNVHGSKYDYSKTIYGKNNNTKVCIICPEHGEFWQTPGNHLSGKGCPKCCYISSNNSNRYTNDIFITKSNIVHNNRYDYSKVEYVNSKTKVCIICPEHGEFWQSPDSHLQGQGCPKCVGKNKSDKDFIEVSNLVHHHKYDYSITKYCGVGTKVDIICPIHGIFSQFPAYHLQGCGCPKCKSSHMEIEVRQILKENNIKVEEQKKFEWLGTQSLDFYLPEYNIAIECQGIQHFESVEIFGGNDSFKRLKERDKRKKELCLEHNITILYYSNFKYNFPYDVYTDINEIINKINKLI